MKAVFDDSAQFYDEQFTNTSIGRLQRNRVWAYLENIFEGSFPKKILELNCGTGEDAIFFARKNSEVLATDISPQMLKETEVKIAKNNASHFVKTLPLDVTRITQIHFSEKYNLVFSNFGGLNCIDSHQLKHLLKEISTILSPKGRVILVIMPRFCAWETLYFSSKANFTKAFRRRKSAAQNASLQSNSFPVWYHSPNQVAKIASECYSVIDVQPIGIFIPPSYLQNSILAKKGILKKLDSLEGRLNKYKALANMADHYLIDLELK